MARTDVPEGGGFSLGYRPQLDGIRAVAVVAVMLFHASIGFNERGKLLPGGYLGVDVFFALSGFLITTILAQEWLRRRHIDFGAFYARRALRLLPAIVLVVVVVLVLAQVVLTADAAHFARRQSLWTLFYGQNWHAVISPAAFPGYLDHAWSLSVEEQFYVLWPLVLWGVLSLRRSVNTTLVIVLAGASVSAIAMAVIGESDPLHAFYGTDARVQTLLLGAALGLAAVFGRLPTGEQRWTARAGWVGAGALVVAFVTYDNTSTFNTRGGLTLVAIAATALVFGVVCAPHTLLGRMLGSPVPVAVGRISYGLYLWHYPVFLAFTRDDTGLTVWATGLSFWPLLAVRLVLTFALAAASFAIVERPFLRIKRRFERLAEQPGAAVVLAPGMTVPQ